MVETAYSHLGLMRHLFYELGSMTTLALCLRNVSRILIKGGLPTRDCSLTGNLDATVIWTIDLFLYHMQKSTSPFACQTRFSFESSQMKYINIAQPVNIWIESVNYASANRSVFEQTDRSRPPPNLRHKR